VAAAVDTVLGDPAYAAAAARIGDSFRAAGGADAAADALLEPGRGRPDGLFTRRAPSTMDGARLPLTRA
jgi:hypothetical protein